MSNINVERGICRNPLEIVGEGKIPIKSRRKVFNVVNEQVRLEGMSCPGRGDGAEGGHAAMHVPDSLRTPEQEREFLKGEGFFPVTGRCVAVRWP